MVREMNIEELVVVYQGIRRCIVQGAPIKTPLIETGDRISKAVLGYEKAKNQIAEKYLTKDESGNFIPKDPKKEPVLVTDYQSKFEDAMVAELEDLVGRKIAVEFSLVSPVRPVLVTDKDGITREFTLRDYLELSGSVDIKVVAFLNQYFINEQGAA